MNNRDDVLANFDRTRELNIKSVGFSFKPKNYTK
jgi:hypothetical protein